MAWCASRALSSLSAVTSIQHASIVQIPWPRTHSGSWCGGRITHYGGMPDEKDGPKADWSALAKRGSEFLPANARSWPDGCNAQWRFDSCTDRPVAERLLTLQASRRAGLLPEVARLTARDRPSAWSPPHARAPGLRARAILEPGRQCPLAPWPGQRSAGAIDMCRREPHSARAAVGVARAPPGRNPGLLHHPTRRFPQARQRRRGGKAPPVPGFPCAARRGPTAP
jgi:hypothetical protein